MRSVRFTMAWLMTVVLVLAIGLAALRHPAGFWAEFMPLLTPRFFAWPSSVQSAAVVRSGRGGSGLPFLDGATWAFPSGCTLTCHGWRRAAFLRHLPRRSASKRRT